MRLLFIRHGDPDYEIDGLTQKGKTEARLLAESIDRLGIDEVYVSPLGRAGETLDYSLKELGMEAKTLEWLQEFPAVFDGNLAKEETRSAFKNELKKNEDTGLYEKRIAWDMMPSYYGVHPELFDVNGWRSSDIAKASNTVEVYDHIVKCFDEFLDKNGYRRNKNLYEATAGNEKTVAFFCHFGVTCVILSHLWNISPFVLLQYLAMAPTSVTELVTEEREKGIAIFRALQIGDITHLTLGKEKPSFAARFCERFENMDQRH
ncbi:histidine phosphatase family protein [Butyrivibrio sp. FCS014]|uniref:histidine phosphatase family protein n=1 Tax=Butyrivibrio sp. FCS014 TaxID=1408304 RepID=UPI0004661B79|nr:histidine phosphatase family protein [Butyrivibrio sp. FCS014]